MFLLNLVYGAPQAKTFWGRAAGDFLSPVISRGITDPPPPRGTYHHHLGILHCVYLVKMFALFLHCFYLVFYFVFTVFLTLFLPCFYHCFLTPHEARAQRAPRR